jgi:hypothetical protein
MQADILKFFDSLRFTSIVDVIKEEFNSKAERLQNSNTKLWEMVIVDEDNDSAITFHAYFAAKSLQEAKLILQSIEAEMDAGAFNEQKRKDLMSYIESISITAERLKNYYHLRDFAFLPRHLENIVQNLTTFYLSERQPTHAAANATENHTLIVSKLRWIGGVASLGTLFRELSTNPFLNSNGPNLVATRKQLATFLFDHFVDEKDEQFSYDSLYTFLAKSDRDAKRNKIPLGEIEAKSKEK